jgi:YVTN family beta-propeller protein
MVRRNPGSANAAVAWLAAGMVLALAGCDQVPQTELPGDFDILASDPGTGLPEASFASPQGVAVSRGLAFVANPNVGWSGQTLVFGAGFLTVVRLADGGILERIPVSARNPQVVVAAGDRVVVLCSGATAFDGTTVRPAGDGSVVVLDAARAVAGQSALVREIPVPASAVHPLVGYPSSLALSADGRRAWLGSGTAPALFLVDLDAGTVLRGTTNPVALGDLDAQDTIVVRPGPGGTLLAGRFENNAVVVLDGTTGEPSPSHPVPFPVGTGTQSVGVQDIALRPGASPDVYVLLGLASSITAVDSAQGPAGVRNGFATTGLYPNRLLLDGDRLLVVNSGDNNVTALDPNTGHPLGKVAILPTGTNPYDIAVYADGTRTMAAVTGQQSGSLFVVDLDTAAIVREVR